MIHHLLSSINETVSLLYRGYLGPGGRHENGKYFNCAGGAAGYIDKILLTLSHIDQKPAIDPVYGSGPFDPEGILGKSCVYLRVSL